MNKKTSLITGVFLLIAIPIWLLAVAPILTAMPDDFHFAAEIFSIDNFYDEAQGEYSGEQLSVTQYSYKVAEKKDRILIVNNLFDVRTPAGEKIFAVERHYGIDPMTGQHTPGYGDRDRDGYLFAPRGLSSGEPFTYWHINYDGPAQMQFVAKEDILGLVVYKYESRYVGTRIDQTAQLGHLPGVPEARGVELEPYLQLWVEPKTGRMIKYEDQTTAYYYDVRTGERLNPWNSFGNRFAQSSVAEQVRLARQDIKKQKLVNMYVPITLGVVALIFLGLGLRRRQQSNQPVK